MSEYLVEVAIPHEVLARVTPSDLLTSAALLSWKLLGLTEAPLSWISRQDLATRCQRLTIRTREVWKPMLFGHALTYSARRVDG